MLSLDPLLLAAWALVVLVPGVAVARIIQRQGSRLALRLAGCRLTGSGLRALEARGPFLLASNHCSYIDVLVLLALLPLEAAFVAKKEVLGWPFLGRIARRAGHLTVDRGDTLDSLATVTKVAEGVRAGCSVLVFPEGTFTPAAGLRPFRLGVFKVAADTGTPIVPLALAGTRRVLRDGTWLPRPGPITLWAGAPVAPPSGDWRGMVALRDRVAGDIEAHCGESNLHPGAADQEPNKPA